MAERKTPRRAWETALIVGNRIENRLLRFINADAFAEPEPVEEGKKPPKSHMMTGDQVHAALGLLKKYKPDLKSVEVTGNPDKPVVTRIVRTIIDPARPQPTDAPDIRTPDSSQ